MKRDVAVTLSPAQVQKLLEGDALEINLPPDAGKLIVKCKQDVFSQMLGMMLKRARK